VVLGVDDWAKRKGHTYGTILVDLERHRPIDLLPDREAATFAAWLQTHPGVQVISRDRGGPYADGARRGAPHAIQIADRWHLLKNLGDALEGIVTREHAAVRQAAQAVQAAEQERTDAAISAALGMSTAHADGVPRVEKPRTPSILRANEMRSAQRERRLAVYTEVIDLHRRGVPQREIARRLGMGRNTVRRYVHADGYPEPLARGRPRSSALDRYKPSVLARWREGCTDATRIWHELREQGFRRGVDVVMRFVSVLSTRF